jgi:hypothetical protein
MPQAPNEYCAVGAKHLPGRLAYLSTASKDLVPHSKSKAIIFTVYSSELRLGFWFRYGS